jgi:hypothetical protein
MAAKKSTEETAVHVPDEKVEAKVESGEPVLAAPTMNINTANGAGSKFTEAEFQRELDQVARVLGEMPTKTISIPKQMAATVGESLPAIINGVKIVVPVNGESYEIPEPYYNIIMNSLKTIHSGDVRADLNLGKDLDAEALVAPKKR